MKYEEVVKYERRFVGKGIEEMVKLFDVIVEGEDWEELVVMCKELLEYYGGIVDKRREYGKRYRSKIEMDREELKRLRELVKG